MCAAPSFYRIIARKLCVQEEIGRLSEQKLVLAKFEWGLYSNNRNDMPLRARCWAKSRPLR
jgi:hypothetical protein